MSNGINFNSMLSLAEIALAPMTGGSSLMMAAGSQAMMSAATDVMGKMLDNLGASSSTKQNVMESFKDALNESSGHGHHHSSAVDDLADQIKEAANNQSSNGTYTGDLDRAVDDTAKKLTDFVTNMGQTSSGNDAGSGGDSWLVAMAKAMGKTLGDKAQEMKNLSDQVTAEGSDAKSYNTDLTKLQGVSQEYGIMSNAFSQIIKSIGDGLSSMARKQ